MRVIDLAGSPGEIGVAHGVALADEIAEHLRRWKAHVRSLGVADPDAWARELVDATGFLATASIEAPALVEEIEGIREGAGISHADAWLLQLMDESWRALPAPRPTGAGCTSFAVLHGLRSWSGQTMDLEGFRRGLVAVLRVRPDHGPPQLVLTMAGCVGLLGLSAAGFAVWCNALAQVPYARTGLPVALVIRRGLAQPDFERAVEAVRDAPHASGQHYAMVAAEAIGAFECSPAGVVPVMPGSARTWHTNHPLVGYVPEPEDAESDARWEAVRPILQLPSWGTVRTRELLQLGPVCRPWRDDASTCTFAAAYAELGPSGNTLWVTDDPPHADAWERVGWDPAH